MPDQPGEKPNSSYIEDDFLEDISLENVLRVIEQIQISLGHIASNVEVRLTDDAPRYQDTLTNIADVLATLATSALNLRGNIGNSFDLAPVANANADDDSKQEVSEEVQQPLTLTTRILAMSTLLGLIEDYHSIDHALKAPETKGEIIILPSGKEVLIASLTETLIVPDELPAAVVSKTETSIIEFLADSVIKFDNEVVDLGNDRRIRNLLNVFLLRQGHPSGPEEIKKLGFPSAGSEKSTSTMISKKRRRLSDLLSEAAKRDVIIAVGASTATKYLFDRPIRVIDSRKAKNKITTNVVYLFANTRTNRLTNNKPM